MSRTALLLAALCLAGLAGTARAKSIQCLDMSGDPVDWWIVLKTPVLPDGGTQAERDGKAFGYMDANQDFSMTSGSLSDKDQAVAHTLQQLYSDSGSSKVGYLFYNDETPDGAESESRGHTKGVVGFDSSTGFWLVHSVPRWPAASGKSYDFPDMEVDYGQHFLCTSFSAVTINDLAQQFAFTYPQLYDSNLPSSLASKMDKIQDTISNKHVTGDPYTNIVELTTLGGKSFTSMAKNKEWNSDLYDELVAPTLKESLRTETWQNGRGKMNSKCGTYDIENIESVAINSDVGWSSTKDHSKWVIASARKEWTCLGDINRQDSQRTRGGQTMCVDDSDIHRTFASFVKDVESCSSSYFGSNSTVAAMPLPNNAAADA